MIILGIDPGLAAMGWGVLKKNKSPRAGAATWEVLGYGSVQTRAGEELTDRLNQIHLELEKLLLEFGPDSVAIEELFFGANAKTAIAVGEARGVILLACGQKRVSVYEYTPLQIKVALTSYGRAEKAQVQRMVQKFLNLDKPPKPDHAADALACAYCHALSSASVKIIETKR